MSEPKGPPGISDAATTKKSSKKNITRQSVASHAPVTLSAPFTDAVLQIPRIALAEPKPDVDTTRKPSKKRTSSASRGGDLVPTSGPDVLSTIDAAAAKEKADAEREKQMRREAKKQRAKELEETKRRQEVEKEVLEEAQRLHDQRQREARQKLQLEALNANAEECQEDAEEYEDEGFENYDEDFENEESPVKSNLLPAGVGKLSDKTRGGSSSSAADEAELRRVQLAMQAETKGLQFVSLTASGRPPSSHRDEQSDEIKLSTTLSLSIAGLKQSLDPRAKRVKEIRERRKFEIEKFSLFQLNPVSEHDKVLNRLRRGLIKQAFVQTSDGARALGTQTKALGMHDKSMHFPDDIGMDVAMNHDDDTSFTSASTSRFFRFLEHAAYVCESLAVENIMASEREAQDKRRSENSNQSKPDHQLSTGTKLDHKIIFPCNEEVTVKTLNEMVQSRDLVALRFSPVVSSILLSCYGDARNELTKPFQELRNKTLSCVWDINRPSQPLHLLQSEGVASSACLSPSRDLFVIVGTQDGLIHVWDLRPQSTIQSSNLLVDGQAVCTPAYSTCGLNYRAPEQHTSTIVALETIDWSKGSMDTGRTFQFGSMDDRGVLIIWSLIELNAKDDADKCVQIGGNIKLIMNTRIDVQQHDMTRPPRGSPSIRAALPLVPSIGPAAAELKFMPHALNQFVVGMRTGQVVRCNRFDNASARMQYQREQGLGSAHAWAGVVCIDFHPFASKYFLVGYEDGCICLYHVDVSVCLTSWEEVAFGVSVSTVAWSPSRPGVFYASYSDTTLLVWDLVECTSGPTLLHKLDRLQEYSPVELASALYPLVLSSEKTRTSRPAIAWRIDPSVSPFQFSVYELGPEFTSRAATEQQTLANVLACIL